MAFNITVTLDKLTRKNEIDFGKYQEKLVHFLWSQTDSDYLGVLLKFFKNDHNTDFRRVHDITKGKSNVNQFFRLQSD